MRSYASRFLQNPVTGWTQLRTLYTGVGYLVLMHTTVVAVICVIVFSYPRGNKIFRGTVTGFVTIGLWLSLTAQSHEYILLSLVKSIYLIIGYIE